MAGLEVTIDKFPSAIINENMKVPLWDSGTQQTMSVLVSELRNIAATIEEGGTGKTASNENLKSANKRITDLASAIDTSFQGINQNFTNVDEKITATNNAVATTNENIENHELDKDIHTTKEKQEKWDGYATQLSENTQQISGLKNGSGAEIALLNGWAKGRSASVFKSGKTAFLNVDCSGGLISSGTLIFTLPNGFIPVRTLTLPCMVTSSLSINTSAILVLDTGGNGALHDIQNNSNSRLTINCIFECGV